MLRAGWEMILQVSVAKTLVLKFKKTCEGRGWQSTFNPFNQDIVKFSQKETVTLFYARTLATTLFPFQRVYHQRILLSSSSLHFETLRNTMTKHRNNET